MNRRAIVVASLVLSCGALPFTAEAHDCSSAADCAMVLYNWGWLVALLAFFLGLLATGPPSSKEKACKSAENRLWMIQWVMLPFLAVLALAGAIGAFFLPESAGFEFVIVVMFIAFAGGTVSMYVMYRRDKKECDDP